MFEQVFDDASILGSTVFNSTPEGQYTKLQEEVRELGDDPSDLNEIVDCMLVLMIGAAASGHTSNDVLMAMHHKLEKCKNRKWKLTDNGTYHHVKEQ